jgi:hypothetical protein
MRRREDGNRMFMLMCINVIMVDADFVSQEG